jgi:hypothetical protein
MSLPAETTKPYPTLPGREGLKIKVSPTGGDLEGAYGNDISYICFTKKSCNLDA